MLAALMPEHAIIVDEGVSFGLFLLSENPVCSAARLVAEHRLRYWYRIAARHRRRHCCSWTASDLAASRRLGNVYRAGVVDTGS